MTGRGVGLGPEEGGGIAPSGISPLLSTRKGSEGTRGVESRNRLGYWLSAASRDTHQVRERERSCVADLVTRVGGHPDERLVWNRRHRQRVPSAVCLRYSTGRVYEVPSFPTVAVCLF